MEAAWDRSDAGHGVIEPYLQRGERPLWSGQPDPTKLFTSADWFLVPITVLWGGFAFAWETIALVGVVPLVFRGAPPFVLLFPVLGLVFVIFGAYLIFGRFIHKRRRKRRTHYAITDRRAIALEVRRRGVTVAAAFLDSVPALFHNVSRDGTGWLAFGRPPGTSAWYENTGLDPLRAWPVDLVTTWLGGNPPVVFYDVKGVEEVRRVAEDARAEMIHAREQRPAKQA